jgi:predicted DNA-binding WGR domain protein
MTTLYRINPEANMARFYAVTIQPTLFGEWTLVREWGRVGRRPQSLINTYPTIERAADATNRLIARKKRRGYS